MFAKAKCIIGFSPVTREDITHYAWREEGFNQNKEIDTDAKVFHSPAYKNERNQVAHNIAATRL